MKNSIISKVTYLILVIVAIGLNNSAVAQDDRADEECWCKYVTSGPGFITVSNIDSLVKNSSEHWRIVKDCNEAECEGTCKFEHWVCREKECFWKEFEGECTSEIFGEEVPWEEVVAEPKTREKGDDCDCIGKKITDNYIVYSNVSDDIENQKPDSPIQHRMMRDCSGECGSNNCVYAIYNYDTGSIEVREGICRDDWPADEKDSTGVEVVVYRNMITDLDGNKIEINENLSFYPNPGSEQITIVGPADTKTTIFNMAGETVLESNELTIDISTLRKGVYLLVMEAENAVMSDKLIVE